MSWESLKKRGIKSVPTKTTKIKNIDQREINALKYEIQRNYELYLDAKLSREEFLIIKNNINEQLSNLKEKSKVKEEVKNIVGNTDLELTNEIVKNTKRGAKFRIKFYKVT